MQNQTGTTSNHYLYTGQQFDPSSGLYSLRARYYAPGVGRFLSQDTYAVNFSNPRELNRYGYTANNPVNASDPSGNQAFGEYGGFTLDRAMKTVAVVAFIGTVGLYAYHLIALALAPSIGTLPFPKGGTGSGNSGGSIGKVIEDAILTAATLYLLLLKVGEIEDVDEGDWRPKDKPKLRKVHLAFGTNDYLLDFTTNLRDIYASPDTVILDGSSIDQLAGSFSIDNFDKAFFIAIHHSRVEKIHFNLEGILRASTPTYTSFIKKFANNGVFLNTRNRVGKDFLVTAWELYVIGSDPALCTTKTIFYKNSNLQEDPSAKAQICSGAFR